MARTPRTFSRRGRAEAKAGGNIVQGEAPEDVIGFWGSLVTCASMPEAPFATRRIGKGLILKTLGEQGKLKGCGMSKGNTCPNCGQPKFQPKSKKSKSVYECTNPNCRAVGWLGFPKGVGSGKGAECPRCRQRTKRVILSDKRLRIKIRFCTNTDCRAISIRKLKKRKKS